jgi:hypothetical protein
VIEGARSASFDHKSQFTDHLSPLLLLLAGFSRRRASRTCTACTTRTAAAAAAATTSAAATARRRESVCQQLRSSAAAGGCARSHEDELTALMHVCHRNAGLSSSHRELRDDLTGLFVVSVQQRIRPVTRKQQRLRHQ